ncbi:Yct1p LALA0_S10e00122g [Lachancea lanzarotensis]|uniref:LALA0S10e00122g1_1 n=1 Tax=Lachancea lanzarotensis TaxID=1245769 RepID=A0A0C7MVN8_9SACH|nr:uncharacterized protein LALA0_S10e00122g [Lachancea lanzarotensis]CEP64007.1 LALA0S10e00122g1_1 [Lachancea lanzarotensis]
MSKNENILEVNDLATSNAGEVIVPSRLADATLHFMEQHDSETPRIEENEEKRLKRKLFFFIYCLVFAINLLLYMDKAILSYDAILGFFEDTGLTQNTYNTVNTLFYVGYAVGQFPGQFLAQRLPLRSLLTILLATWTCIVFLHCTAYNFSGVAALRFFLGLTESIVMPILINTMSMFFDSTERAAAQPFFFVTCMGAPIPTGFIAYGVLHIKNANIELWRIFTIIIGGLTFIMTIVVALMFPNNPTSAKFFSVKERVWVIRRVQSTTGSSIEQKVFKTHQFKEAIHDYITWLFFLFFVLQQLANNLPYQQNLLFEGMGGVDALGSTLVSVAGAGFSAVAALIASLSMLKWANISTFTALFWNLPPLIGSISAVSLPWHNKIGILANICMAGQVFGIPFIIALSWSSSSTSGYTKRFTRSSISLLGYAIGNIISPQIWREKDAPRFFPAWIVQIILSFGLAPCILIFIWWKLRGRNQQRLLSMDQTLKRLSEKYELSNDRTDEFKNGSNANVVSNLAVLDLTDLENESFLYPL